MSSYFIATPAYVKLIATVHIFHFQNSLDEIASLSDHLSPSLRLFLPLINSASIAETGTMLNIPINQLHNQATYQGLNVQTQRGSLIAKHLAKTLQTLKQSQSAYLESFCIRVDLHVPEDHELADNEVMERFIASLRSKITHSTHVRTRQGIRVHPTKLRFVWCRELSITGRPHYHVFLMLNKQSYCHLGLFDLGHYNLYTRIHRAWASALGVPLEDVIGLVHFPENPTMILRQDDQDSLNEVFHRVSYFTKEDTKEVGQGFHTFGVSRG